MIGGTAMVKWKQYGVSFPISEEIATDIERARLAGQEAYTRMLDEVIWGPRRPPLPPPTRWERFTAAARSTIGRRLRNAADRIDPDGAPDEW